MHAAEVIPCVAETLAEADTNVCDLAGLVVGAGPGSFTGVRVAAATAKGIAHALNLPLWPFSSLEAAAVSERVSAPRPIPGERGALREEELRYVLFDARGDRVYAACYLLGVDGIEQIVSPCATHIRELLEEVAHRGACFVGDGAVRHEAVLQAAGHRVLPPPAGIPSADGLLYLLALHPDRAPVETAQWQPEYVKASSAERARVG